jgi:hypothetical protein
MTNRIKGMDLVGCECMLPLRSEEMFLLDYPEKIEGPYNSQELANSLERVINESTWLSSITIHKVKVEYQIVEIIEAD